MGTVQEELCCSYIKRTRKEQWTPIGFLNCLSTYYRGYVYLQQANNYIPEQGTNRPVLQFPKI